MNVIYKLQINEVEKQHNHAYFLVHLEMQQFQPHPINKISSFYVHLQNVSSFLDLYHQKGAVNCRMSAGNYF